MTKPAKDELPCSRAGPGNAGQPRRSGARRRSPRRGHPEERLQGRGARVFSLSATGEPIRSFQPEAGTEGEEAVWQGQLGEPLVTI